MFTLSSFEPELLLKEWIKSYWFVNYHKSSQACEPKVIMPFDCVCLLFVIESSPRNIYDGLFELKPGVYVCAPSKKRHLLNVSENLYYIDVSLYPGVFTKLFKIPAVALGDRIYNVKELSLNIDGHMIEKLYELKHNQKATLLYLNQYFHSVFSTMREDALLSNIIDFTKNPQIERFYDNSGLSTRQMQRKVKEMTGMSLKSIERINRFYSTVRYIKHHDANMFNTALENSFYDQSSLIKEFKSFTGLTPKSFMQNPQSFLQYQCDIFC